MKQKIREVRSTKAAHTQSFLIIIAISLNVTGKSRLKSWQKDSKGCFGSLLYIITEVFAFGQKLSLFMQIWVAEIKAWRHHCFTSFGWSCLHLCIHSIKTIRWINFKYCTCSFELIWTLHEYDKYIQTTHGSCRNIFVIGYMICCLPLLHICLPHISLRAQGIAYIHISLFTIGSHCQDI